MEVGALAPYERALRSASALGLHTADGRVLELDVARWLSGVDAADETVLERCRGPVLDVGCGPGRFVSELSARGVAALGVDIAQTAIALTRGQGLPALLRSVFAALPGEGRWPTVLLLDGNIGIGGEPRRLLERVAALLAPGGRLVVEAAPDPDTHEVLRVRFSEQGRPVGPSFEWANVGLTMLERYAVAAGYEFDEIWVADGRTFAAFAR
jgi:SAM-dependent methyltransferase